MRVAERYPQARIVALSTGNVYPLSAAGKNGSVEQDPLTPVGEYANSAIARERILEHNSALHQTPIALLRLFYAVELRYGVLVDLAWKVLKGEPVSLNNGYFNCIWQGDANEMILRSFSLTSSPPSVWNLCRSEIFSVREVAHQLGALLKRTPQFAGAEMDGALLGNASKLNSILGPPSTKLETMLRWIAHWVNHGGHCSGNPTHFEMRDGQY
jgi:nucleoside-diphosphate-sugar epimerase